MYIKLYRTVILSLVCFLTIQVKAQNIIVQSDASGTGSLIVDTFGVNYSTEVQRYVHSENWHIISSPVSGQQLGLFVTGSSIVKNTNAGDFDLAPYNELTNAWNPYTESSNTNDFELAKGYSTRRSVSGNVVFTGNVNMGSYSIPVSRDNNGWNAVGNPYSSIIRLNGSDGLFEENVAIMDPSYVGLYVWDQSIDDYSILNKIDEPGVEPQYQVGISVGQGFIIKANTAGSINFTRAMQLHSTETFSPFKSAEIQSTQIKLLVRSGGMTNTSLVTLKGSSTEGLDPGYDIGKLKGNPNLALYTQLLIDNGVDFAIQSLPKADISKYRIPIGLDFTRGGFITFSAETFYLPSDAKIILEDTQTKTFTRLDVKNAKYETSIEQKVSGFGRFYLHTSDLNITDVEDFENTEFAVYSAHKKIHVQGGTDGNTIFKVYSVDGKMWYQNKAQNQNYNTIDASDFASGVYILHIQKQGKTSIHKLVLAGN